MVRIRPLKPLPDAGAVAAAAVAIVIGRYVFAGGDDWSDGSRAIDRADLAWSLADALGRDRGIAEHCGIPRGAAECWAEMHEYDAALGQSPKGHLPHSPMAGAAAEPRTGSMRNHMAPPLKAELAFCGHISKEYTP